MEILEWALGKSLVGWHLEACRDGKLPSVAETMLPAEQRDGRTWKGKGIVYAARNVEVTAEATARLLAENKGRAWPMVADIPMPRTHLMIGHPAATVFAEGTSRADVVAMLWEKVHWCREVLGC
jgi:predicted ATP-grasp superfamily ATP-dependent carboligase